MSIQTKETMVLWVKDHAAGSPSLAELALYVGYSPFYCSAKFREHTGMTYKKFLANCRLQAAASDLIKTDDRITEIAFRYGYSTSESLSRAFAAAYHCAPREFRKTCRHT